MFEIEIYNKKLNEHSFMYGKTIEEAWKKNPQLDRNEWTILLCERLY